jgi:hypothetical protein
MDIWLAIEECKFANSTLQKPVYSTGIYISTSNGIGMKVHVDIYM